MGISRKNKYYQSVTNEGPSSYRRPRSEQARENRNAYMRKYRREHPEQTRIWRQNYIMRAAERLIGAQGGGDE